MLPKGAVQLMPLAIFPVAESGSRVSFRFAPEDDEATIRNPLNGVPVGARISMSCDTPAVMLKGRASLSTLPSIRTSRPKKLRVPSPCPSGR
jgi:hypothetical protein